MSTMVLDRQREAVRHADPRALRLALFTDSYIPQLNGVALLLGRLVEAVRAARCDCARVHDERSGGRGSG